MNAPEGMLRVWMAQSPVACVPQIYGVVQDGPGIFGWWASQSLGTFVSRWTGSGWAPMGGNFQSVPQRFIIFDDGNGPRLVVAGEFDHIGGVPMPRIVAWNGTSWEGLGPIGFSPGAVNALAVFDDGSGPALYLATSPDSPRDVREGKIIADQLIGDR
jgi:hypothetical protein